MKKNPELIKTSQELDFLMDQLSKVNKIAFDTEFIREKTFTPNLALIQVATDNEIWLIDSLAFTKKNLQPFLNYLQDREILKILHSAHGDQECLWTSYQMTARPTFDTFEAASLLGYGESVSLRDLAKKVLGVKIPKFLTRTDWLKRPLPEEMRLYAMTDVEYLVPIANKLIEELDQRGRKEWAFELSSYYESPKIYSDQSEEITYRIAKSGRVNAQSFAILKDLVLWREKRAREINIPRKRVADDNTLVNIAKARPTTKDNLSNFRGLNPGEIRRSGDLLIKIISKDHSHNDIKLPTPPKILKPSPQQSRIIDFLSTYLKAICQEKKIASRLVMTIKDLQKIVVENILDPEQWVKRGICTQRACELICDDFLAVLKGQRGLAIKNNRLEILKI